MSFGLCKAPATFQRLMNLVVSGLEVCAVYLDDVVVIPGKTTFIESESCFISCMMHT